jgi:hypothetical protein
VGNSERASSQVVIQCPACGASETADPAVLAGSPMIVCRKCGETWPVAARRTRRRAGSVAETADGDDATLIEAQRRPLVTYSDGTGKAWAAKMDADVLPVIKERSPVPMMAAAVAAVLFMAVLFGARERAVAALPDLGGLYAAIGMPVNLTGLRLEGVTAERLVAPGNERVFVSGTIRNRSGAEEAVPALVASFEGAGQSVGGGHGFRAPAERLGPGEEAAFRAEIVDAPRQAATIILRFRRPGEPPGGAEGAPGPS